MKQMVPIVFYSTFVCSIRSNYNYCYYNFIEENTCKSNYGTWITVLLSIIILYLVCNLAWKVTTYLKNKTLQDFNVTRVFYQIRRGDSTANLTHSEI